MTLTDEFITDIRHRIHKRWRHLHKWARREMVHYFRVFDRDLPGAPFMIDCLPDYWLVWVCDHASDDTVVADLTQAVSTVLTTIMTKKVVIKYRQKSNVGTASYRTKDCVFPVVEGGLTFELNITRYLDTGLFIDHRLTREFIRTQAKGCRVLNLFSYTGSFSCYALAGHARFVRSVDLNPRYSMWHDRNCQLNGFSSRQYDIVTADVMSFLKSHQAKYDIIICDPPSFSHSKRKSATRFHIQDDANQLLMHCMDRLRPGGWVLFSNNYRSFNIDKSVGHQDWSISEKTHRFCSPDYKGKWASRCWVMSPHSK
jgi:23S rRNA G2069 N7-methylase RlmK/C1962 C5-methylase RlmI